MVKICLLQSIHVKSVGKSLTLSYARNVLRYPYTKATITSEFNSRVDHVIVGAKANCWKKASAQLTNTVRKR